jgi:hypothetical protein
MNEITWASIVWGNEAWLKNELANGLKTASVESQLVSEALAENQHFRAVWLRGFLRVEAFALASGCFRVIHRGRFSIFSLIVKSFLMTLLGLYVSSNVQSSYKSNQSLDID